MKAKLIKTEVNYILEDDKGVVIASTSLKKDGLALSLKNCETIELGYDLDKLINRAFDYMGYHSTVTPHEEKQFKLGYRIAFREALELLGDKKFGINEVVELCKILMSNPFEKCGKTYQELTDNYIQSLQQTEWDVEVVMQKYLEGYEMIGHQKGVYGSGNRIPIYNSKPKLDADGCLILKRID